MSQVFAGQNVRDLKSAGLIAAAESDVPVTSIHTVEADAVRIIYRAAKDEIRLATLLRHGFPSSFFVFRELIPRLTNKYRIVASDLPGFRFTEVPEERCYRYSFDALAKTPEAASETLSRRARL